MLPGIRIRFFCKDVNFGLSTLSVTLSQCVNNSLHIRASSNVEAENTGNMPDPVKGILK